MKQISLTPAVPAPEGMPTYASLIHTCIVAVPHGEAVMLDEQRKRIRVLDALEALSDDATELFLEDAEAVTLSTCVKNMPWGVVSRDLLLFAEAVISACTTPYSKG